MCNFELCPFPLPFELAQTALKIDGKSVWDAPIHWECPKCLSTYSLMSKLVCSDTLCVLKEDKYISMY